MPYRDVHTYGTWRSAQEGGGGRKEEEEGRRRRGEGGGGGGGMEGEGGRTPRTARWRWKSDAGSNEREELTFSDKNMFFPPSLR